ncbi:hypothetical protein DFP72DRAFT_1067562 [Ephemerocybe angulata]|uniref:Uncharacterized protein n=1 Tax=Ephemerocybe angulata TaxID=980116 RepID=A0A8H6I0Q0_9AGAR|nr:hypothetical protein DFP72DRAFT_1067562 [Tulosesus angulatus]
MSRLLRSLSCPTSTLAKNIRLGLISLQLDFDMQYPEDFWDREELCHDLAQFMLMFPRVEYLTLGNPTIKTVLIPILQERTPPLLPAEDEELYAAARILFPSLKEITVSTQVLEDDHLRAIVESYALWREDMGLPILLEVREHVPYILGRHW